MPVCGDPVGRYTGDHQGLLEERFRGGHVVVLAEHYVDQRARAIDGTIEITPLPVDLDVGLVDVPATAGFAASASPEAFSQLRRVWFPSREPPRG